MVVAVTMLALASGVALLVVADDDGSSVAADATTTSSSRALTSTTATSTVTPDSTAPPPTATPTTSAAPAPAPTAATTAPPPARCPRPSPGSDFAGFGAAEIVIENGQGAHRSCVLTADTPRQQQRGLMHQDDLDGYDGMIFRFPDERERSFWMRNTRIPLSIAFFDTAGRFVSAKDMEPCGDSRDCPTYSSDGPARFALEVPKGGLPALGATEGSRLLP